MTIVIRTLSSDQSYDRTNKTGMILISNFIFVRAETASAPNILKDDKIENDKNKRRIIKNHQK